MVKKDVSTKAMELIGEHLNSPLGNSEAILHIANIYSEWKIITHPPISDAFEPVYLTGYPVYLVVF